MMQAVLLAGGRGTRLAPLTDAKPKALVDVAGRPFLSHLTAALRDQGVTHLLILAGYRADQLVQAAQTLSVGTIALSTVAGAEEWSTGERLWHAREHLDPEFLLLYSDNLSGFNLDRLRHRFEGGDFDVVLSELVGEAFEISFEIFCDFKRCLQVVYYFLLCCLRKGFR